MHLNLTMYFAGLGIFNSIFDAWFERSHIASKTGKGQFSFPKQGAFARLPVGWKMERGVI